MSGVSDTTYISREIPNLVSSDSFSLNLGLVTVSIEPAQSDEGVKLDFEFPF